MNGKIEHRPVRVTQANLDETRWQVSAICACGFACITYGPREAADEDAFSRLLLHVRAATLTTQEGRDDPPYHIGEVL